MAEKPMKALSVQQPWAWLIVKGYKDIENRDWCTRFRGALLIHAGKKYDAEGERWVRRTFPDIPLPPREQLEFGGIVGRVEMVGCSDALDGPWFFGRFGFAFEQPKPLPFRAFRGMLGFFDVPDEPDNPSLRVSR